MFVIFLQFFERNRIVTLLTIMIFCWAVVRIVQAFCKILYNFDEEDEF